MATGKTPVCGLERDGIVTYSLTIQLLLVKRQRQGALLPIVNHNALPILCNWNHCLRRIVASASLSDQRAELVLGSPATTEFAYSGVHLVCKHVDQSFACPLPA